MAKKTKFPIAQEFLEQYEKWEAIADNKLIEKRQWKELALKITAQMDGERVQSSGVKDKMASALECCVDAEDEIEKSVKKLKEKKKEVTQTIESLYSPTEYKLLHLRYIQYVPLKDIADLWGMDYTNITTIHGRALKNVERLLNENDT